MQEDFLAYKEVQEAQQHNWNEKERVARQLAKYRLVSFLTLGIYMLFVKKPTVQLREVSKDKIVFTGILICGPQHVSTGIHELVERDMLKLVSEGEGENALDVLFPTPLLISTIMQKQRLATA